MKDIGVLVRLSSDDCPNEVVNKVNIALKFIGYELMELASDGTIMPGSSTDELKYDLRAIE